MAKKSGGGKVTFVVQSKVKDLVRKAKMKCSSDVIGGLNELITRSVTRGVERAKANGRKTLRASDI